MLDLRGTDLFLRLVEETGFIPDLSNIALSDVA
jgi:hypothetical protein